MNDHQKDRRKVRRAFMAVAASIIASAGLLLTLAFDAHSGAAKVILTGAAILMMIFGIAMNVIVLAKANKAEVGKDI